MKCSRKFDGSSIFFDVKEVENRRPFGLILRRGEWRNAVEHDFMFSWLIMVGKRSSKVQCLLQGSETFKRISTR
jgi:hypothetical protein